MAPPLRLPCVTAAGNQPEPLAQIRRLSLGSARCRCATGCHELPPGHQVGSCPPQAALRWSRGPFRAIQLSCLAWKRRPSCAAPSAVAAIPVLARRCTGVSKLLQAKSCWPRAATAAASAIRQSHSHLLQQALWRASPDRTACTRFGAVHGARPKSQHCSERDAAPAAGMVTPKVALD